MIERWETLWKNADSPQNAEGLFHQLIKAYSAKNRAYHNINHIQMCLSEFDRVKDRLNDPTEVELAIWFHDVIYNPRSLYNEEKSAEFATSNLNTCGISPIRINKVRELILATKHDRSINDSDTKYLVDIDISILGYPPEIYEYYENCIRKEYKWVPKIMYKKKRREVLLSFLDRGQIYQTRFFFDNYELQSRFNLENAIMLL